MLQESSVRQLPPASCWDSSDNHIQIYQLRGGSAHCRLFLYAFRVAFGEFFLYFCKDTLDWFTENQFNSIMPNKLQELTDKLYNEGLSKGKEEGEALLASARKEADEIIENARKEAEAIVNGARTQASDLTSKAESDIKMASAQSLQATKKDIENLLVGEISNGKVDAALSDPDFIKQIIMTVAGKFNAEESEDISLLLPASMQSRLEPWVENELRKALGKGMKAEFSKKISGGFSIGPKNGGWYIDLTEDTFKELIAEYLRPVTRKILFGQDE